MKVVLDANIIIGFLLTKGYILSSIFEYWENNAFKLLVSGSIIRKFKYTKIIGAKQFLEILSGLDYKH